MKKLYLPAVVIAAITLASCAKQEIITEPTPVLFDTFVGKSTGVQTKGTVLDPDLLKSKGFYVQAYMTGKDDWANYTPTSTTVAGNFLANQHITWDETKKWTYTPTAYWPANNGMVSFFAYGASNYNGNKIEGMTDFSIPEKTNAAPSFIFTVNDTVSKQVDLVVAAPQLDKSKPTGGPATAVKFVFKHILSKFDFQARLKNTYSYAEVKVTKVSIVFAKDKVRSNNRYVFDNNATETDNPGYWAGKDITATYLASGDYQPIFTPDDGLILDDSPKSITNDNGHLMLPQGPFIAGIFTIKLEYDITTTATGYSNRTIHYTSEISLPETGDSLQQGKQYTFLFTLDLEAVSISTTTNVSDWTDADESPIESTH